MSDTSLTPAQRDRLREEWDDRCFYCDMPLSTRFEADHFPWPAQTGNTMLVPACVNCHDLKDRVPFEDWPPLDLVLAIRDLTPRSRLLVAKALRIAAAAAIVAHMPMKQ